MSACTAATYIFTAPTCTTIITLEPCALNAEFQHFIPRFNKISLLCRPLKERIGGETEGDFKDNSNVSKSLAIETMERQLGYWMMPCLLSIQSWQLSLQI
jgi:hypothetical protein